MWGVSEKWIISLADTFLWLKRFLFNSFIFLLGDSRVANKPEESKGGHASQKSEKCCIKITSDAVPVLQFMCHRVTFSLLHGCKVLQGITQTARMIQSARVLHLECWDKWRGRGGNFSAAVVMNAGTCYMFQLKLTLICTLLSLWVGKWPNTSDTTCAFLFRFGNFLHSRHARQPSLLLMGELPQFQWPEHRQLQCVGSNVAALATFS